MSIDIQALAASNGGDHWLRLSLVRDLTPADLAPYEDLLNQWEQTPDGDGKLRNWGKSVSGMLREPTMCPVTLPAFAAWMVENNMPDPTLAPDPVQEEDSMPPALIEALEQIAPMASSPLDHDLYYKLAEDLDLSPLRAELNEWNLTQPHPEDLDSIIINPDFWNVSVPMFAAWYINKRSEATPVTTATPPIPTLASLGTSLTVEQFNRIADPNGLLPECREPVQAVQLTQIEPILRLVPPFYLDYPIIQQVLNGRSLYTGSTSAISGAFHYLREQHLIDLTPAAPGGPAAPYTPWGPTHPDWNTFWDKAEKVAQDKGYCGEFDTIVQEIGGRPRPTHEKVTINITKLIDVVVPKGTHPSVTDVIRAMENQLNRFSWDVTNRVPVPAPVEDVGF